MAACTCVPAKLNLVRWQIGRMWIHDNKVFFDIKKMIPKT